jgi:ABC-type Na+ efflux pump permease subunit
VNPVQKVFSKEVREMLRDRRVRVSAFLLPAAVIYMIFNLFGFLGDVVGKKANQKVHVVQPMSPALTAVTKGLVVVQIPSLAEGRKLIEAGKADLVLNALPPGADGQQKIQAFFDPKQQRSQIVLRSVQKMVGEDDVKR